jgi:hypothetical protein
VVIGGASTTSQRTAAESQQVIPQGRQSRSGSQGKDSQSGHSESDEGSLLVAMQQTFFENYHTFAYVLIIGSVSFDFLVINDSAQELIFIEFQYFIAFCLYLYLRLISLIFPGKIIYKRHCQKHENETIVRFEIHYASATVTFLVMATFQLVVSPFFLTQ